MAPGQLKQLKASLREHGLLGPQKSKKQRKSTRNDARKRVERDAALEGIRERFNPFEVKAPSRRAKFEVADGKPSKSVVERPSVTRGMGEERRRDTLLREMQRRNKVGGMLDRRFGENDPTMSLEEKAAERFARQATRTSKKNSLFNLEDDNDDEIVLTHGGRSLDFQDDDVNDDSNEELSDPEQSESDEQDGPPRKRARFEDDGIDSTDDVQGEDRQERKKSKNEVMKELIAKSKMYKAERQKAKEDDDDLRAQLDRGMGDFYEAMRNHRPGNQQLPSPPTDSEPVMDPGRAAMLAGKSREEAEKEYEANLRQMKLEARSKPSVRTKTEEEKASEQKERLEFLEKQRQRRMRGEDESSEEESEKDVGEELEDVEDGPDDARAFGLAQPDYNTRPELAVEDEDDFVLDDIIATDSDAELMSDEEGQEGDDSDIELADDGDDDFINGLVLPEHPGPATKSFKTKQSKDLAFTFPCPQTHEEWMDVIKGYPLSDVPTITQRIRALYHKGLAPENQEKLGNFAAVILQHVSYLADSAEEQPFMVMESLIRHLHSMAKSQPEIIGSCFRELLKDISVNRPLDLTAGDLMILTAVSSIFPTSDHFHPVATPAMLTLTRYLGQSTVESLQDLAKGAYACSLALRYQKLAKRYVPEVITYIGNAIAILAPAPFPRSVPSILGIPLRLPTQNLRCNQSAKVATPNLSFNQVRSLESSILTPVLLLNSFVGLASQSSRLWSSKSAFSDIISPLTTAILHLQADSCHHHLPPLLLEQVKTVVGEITETTRSAISCREPLFLHNHRPLPIKSSLPSFIENFNPDRHYDPDRERAELAKLKHEHKKERKGAMRELRKDANFVAREQLREKKARDEAYEKKFRKLVASINAEEGQEANEYERARKKRKGEY